MNLCSTHTNEQYNTKKCEKENKFFCLVCARVAVNDVFSTAAEENVRCCLSRSLNLAALRAPCPPVELCIRMEKGIATR